MKKILVTGGAGFVWSHLCKRLLDEGNEVFCLDNLFTGNQSNILALKGNPRFALMIDDVTQSVRMQVDQIYNLACPASPVHYQKNPVETMRTCVTGAINMLDLARDTKARILQASTSEVYGDPNVHPQPESYWGNVNPIGIRSCYDEGKRAAETLFMDYHREYRVDTRIIRIFNTYGPHMHPADGRVVSNLIMQALRNEPLTMYGDGSQTRSFQYVDDLVEGMIRLMNASGEDIHLPVNVGTQYEFTMLELAQVIKSLIPKSTSEITFRPLPSDDPRQRKADNTRAFEKLGWQPTIPLEEGLVPTIEYFRQFV